MLFLLMIHKVSKSLVEYLIEQATTEENKNRLKNELVDPIFMYIIDKVYPYVVISSVIFVLMFLIAIMILFLVVKGK